MAPGQLTSANKKAIKVYKEGLSAYNARQDARAEENFLRAIELDPAFMEPHMVLANLYLEQNKGEKRIYHLKEAIRIGPRYYVENYYFLANMEFQAGAYADAKSHFGQFLKFNRIDPAEKEDAEFKIRCCDFGMDALKKPFELHYENMGPGINSEYNEYFPSITADAATFLFTRQLDCSACMASPFQEDLFVAQRAGDSWAGARAVRELSSMGNEGAPSISADGNYMFITMSQEMDGKYMGGQSTGFGSCDLFYTQKVNGRWTKPVNLGPKINSNQWESQPSFSSDGKTLYFVRGTPARSGGIKGIDMYFSEVGEDGKFSQAQKLPANLNTPKNEESVFIHPDNQTLYFSSDGHVGMGGLDIYMSRRKADGSWDDPVNLGSPINTAGDENSLLVSPDGRYGYFASDRKGGFGKLDLYQFEMPESLKPQAITYVNGKVFNAKTRENLETEILLIDLETQKPVATAYSQKSGEFLVTLTAEKNYMVNVSRDGYLFYSDNFSLKGVKTSIETPFRLEIPLEPIEAGSSMELKNVFFEVNKWDLKPESKAELDKLISFLSRNANIKVELGGHTDNSGDKKQNEILSQNRAKAVYEYVLREGKIPPQRLTYKGYGDSKPKFPNDSAENKARNRRTEILILSKD